MPVHVTTDTAQTITGNKTFTGSVSTSVGFTFPNGTTQTIAFTGVTIPPSDRLNNGTVQVVLSSDNNLHFPTGTIGDTLSDGGFTIVGKPGYYAELASHDGNVFAWASDANYANPVGGGFSIGTDTTDLSGGYIWTFGNDGLLRFPDGSIQPTAFTNNLSAYAGLSYVNNNFLNLAGGALTGAVSTTNVLYTTGGNSNQWNSSYSTLQTQSANNLSVYSTVNTYSATTWNPAGRYLPLSGGTVTGATRFDSNVTIFGNLSCSGTQTFNNTVFSTTSAVSVVHTGSGPALWVGNNGTGDIASFNDIDLGVEVFHVGGANGTHPNVGVKTSTPNVDFTVSGAISASSTIYSASGNSDQWNSSYNTIQTNSATTWNYQGTDVKNLTGNWQSSYTALTSTSANWNDVRNTVQTNSATTWNYQGSDVKALTGNWQSSYTALTSTSANWNDTRNTVQTNSATTWNYQGTDVKNLTGNWQASYTALTSTSANWNDTRNTVQANSASWAIDNSTDTGVRELTGNWQSSYTVLTSTSANWNDTRSTVQNNSATTWNYQGTDVKSLTANWQNTYTTFSAQSANNLSVYSTVNANSATWGTGGGGGGLTIFSEVSSVTSPNNTIPTFGLSARSLSANVDFAIIPKGSGALLAQIPDGSTNGGDKRGMYATDWQRVRDQSYQVASGANSIIGGGANNTATGNFAAIVGGVYNTVSGQDSIVGGGASNHASGDTSIIVGGQTNNATGNFAAIVGGVDNFASGANSFIACGSSNNTNNQANTFILGSSITAPSANYTYVNNLSSQGDIRTSSTIYSASGNSNQWNSTYYSAAVSDETTALTAGASKLTFRMPYAMTVTSVRASVGTAPTGSTLIVDINKNGTSILSTKLSIDANEKTSTTAAVTTVISDSSLTDDAEITIDIDQIGSTIAGAGLKVILIGTLS